MKNSQIVWTPAELSAFISDPKTKVKGNRMSYPGVKKPEDVANLIAYLRSIK